MENWEFTEQLKIKLPVLYDIAHRYSVTTNDYFMSIMNINDYSEILISHIFSMDNSGEFEKLFPDFNHHMYAISTIDNDEQLCNRISNQYILNFLVKNETLLMFILL